MTVLPIVVLDQLMYKTEKESVPLSLPISNYYRCPLPLRLTKSNNGLLRNWHLVSKTAAFSFAIPVAGKP